MTAMIAPTRVEISPFPGGKRIAVTTSFDDGGIHDRRLIEAFNAWGLKGTFNLHSTALPRTGPAAPLTSSHIDASEIVELYRGHEVAAHTATHPKLTQLDDAQIAAEVLDNRKALEDLVGYPVRGMAYPYGDYDQRVIAVLRTLGIVYARTVETAACCFPPHEPLAWATTAHQYDTNPLPVWERFARLYESNQGGVFAVWGHSFEFDRHNDWDALARIFQPLAGKPDVWYCTNIELFDYEAARQRLVLAANRASAFNPSAIPVTVNADGTLIDVPPGQTISLMCATTT